MATLAVIPEKNMFDDPSIFLQEIRWKQLPTAEVNKVVLNTLYSYKETTTQLKIDERIGFFPTIIMDANRLIGGNFLIETILDMDEHILIFNAKEVYEAMKASKLIT